MDVKLILPVKVPIKIHTVLNFDGDFDDHGNSEVTYKQNLCLLFFFLTAESYCILLVDRKK